jgi:hypothetical protein
MTFCNCWVNSVEHRRAWSLSSRLRYALILIGDRGPTADLLEPNANVLVNVVLLYLRIDVWCASSVPSFSAPPVPRSELQECYIRFSKEGLVHSRAIILLASDCPR